MNDDDVISNPWGLDAAALERLKQFVDALLSENEQINLTAVRDAPTAWRIHVADSLALLPLLRERSTGVGALLDLGSGGGVPGIPLACVLDDARITLLDSTGKKMAACERIVRAIGLTNVACVVGRAEDLAHETAHRERYDVVTARAVAKLPLLLEWSAGFIKPGGAALLFKTPAAADAEIDAATRAAELCKLRLRDAHRYRLESEPDDRLIIAYEKFAALPIRLPRSAQQAQQRPL